MQKQIDLTRKIFLGFPTFKVSPEILAFGLSIYFSFFLNDILWNDLLKTQTGTATSRWAFFWVVYIAVTALQMLVINLLLWGRSSKWIAIILISATVLAEYYAETYGVHFDTTMLRNILTTNPAEAKELMTASLAVHFLKYATLPILVIAFLGINKNSLIQALTKKVIF